MMPHSFESNAKLLIPLVLEMVKMHRVEGRALATSIDFGLDDGSET